MRFPTILRYGVVILWCLLSRQIETKGLFDHEELHKRLLQHDLLHADETELQVLHEDGKTPQSIIDYLLSSDYEKYKTKLKHKADT